MYRFLFILFLTLLPFFLLVNLFAQAPDTLWTKVFGGSGSDLGHSVQQTSDGGYVVTGHTDSLGAGMRDVWLLKTDASGDTLWTKTFGGSDRDEGGSVQQTSDGGYIITGSTSSFGAGENDVWLIKTDSLGETIWTRTFGGSGWDWGGSVQQTSDGGYIVTGTTFSYGAGENDIWLIKTDSLGETIWTKTFGGVDCDYGGSVQQTSDGGYIVTGTTFSYGAGYNDVWLLKTDASGNTLWTKTFGGSGWDEGNSVQQTSDSGYVITGRTNSYGAGGYDVLLIKTDASGDTLWTRTFGGGLDEGGNSVQQTSDGGYVVTGHTDSYGVGYNDVWLIKTDSSGDTLWTKTFGGSDRDEGLSVRQTSDGGYIVTGVKDAYPNFPFDVGGDVWLIKLKPETTAGNIIRVPQDYTTIQAGINAAQNGDTVLVADDTYYENINFKGKAITVASYFLINGDTSHIAKTIINGSQPANPDSGSVVAFVSGEDTTSVLCGFTITGGSGTIWPTTPHINDAGGGIFIWGAGAQICNNIIENNSPDTTLNRAFGGGIFGHTGNKINIENNTIRNNFASSGGGLYFFAEVNIINNKILKNTASGYGGGIWIIFSDAYIISNNYIKENIATNGGGVTIANSNCNLKNNLIVGNTASDAGGGVLAIYDMWEGLPKKHRNYIGEGNNTIIYNHATSEGGGLAYYCSMPGGHIDVINDIFWGNTATIAPQICGAVNATYSNIEGGWIGTGNTNLDPQFVTGSEYYLLNDPTSPCIDAGNPDSIYNDVEDPVNPGNPLPPAFGTLSNDMGHCGGPYSMWSQWDCLVSIESKYLEVSRYILSQNYPNPFNPSTTIEFNLPHTAEATLKIYNILGEEIVTLLSEKLQGGTHNYEWIPAPGLASGLYFYRLDAEEFVEIKKMILLK